MISRRNALIGVGALTLSGCDAVTRSPTVRKVLTLGEKATLTSQRLVTDRNALAPEYTFPRAFGLTATACRHRQTT